MNLDDVQSAVHAAAQTAAVQASWLNRKFQRKIKCPQKAVGLVIGKGGETLTQLRNISGVLIDQTTKFQGFSTITICDDCQESLDRCFYQIQRLIASCPDVNFVSSNGIDVPENSLRFVIGPKGRVLQQIRDEFSVHLVIGTNEGKSKRVEIFGDPLNVENAKRRIHDILTGKFKPLLQEIKNSASAEHFRLQTELLQVLADASKAAHERHILEVSLQDAQRLQGKRGNLLKQLQKQSLAKIFINQVDDSEKKLVVIVGPQLATSRALGLVRERLKDEVRLIETPNLDAIEEIAHTVTPEDKNQWNKEWEEYTKSLGIC